MDKYDTVPSGRGQGAHTVWTYSTFLRGRHSSLVHNKSFSVYKSLGLKSPSHEFETHDCLRLLERAHRRGESSRSEDSSEPQPTLMWDETAVAFRFVILPNSIPVKSLYYFWFLSSPKASKALNTDGEKDIRISRFTLSHFLIELLTVPLSGYEWVIYEAQQMHFKF